MGVDGAAGRATNEYFILFASHSGIRSFVIHVAEGSTNLPLISISPAAAFAGTWKAANFRFRSCIYVYLSPFGFWLGLSLARAPTIRPHTHAAGPTVLFFFNLLVSCTRARSRLRDSTNIREWELNWFIVNDDEKRIGIMRAITATLVIQFARAWQPCTNYYFVYSDCSPHSRLRKSGKSHLLSKIDEEEKGNAIRAISFSH